ncbi:MAG TPA: NAD-dependent malic enzyme, partial [Dermatophilaceae bacterium]
MSANPSYPEPFSYDPNEPAFLAHEGGKIEVVPTKALRDRADLALLYTPGVAEVSRVIAADPTLATRYTGRGNTVAVITDGTAVLGLGDIGPLAALPVMEGKAVLFKHFAGVDAVPVCLETGTVEELVEAIVRLAPTYGGINLEDISAPR